MPRDEDKWQARRDAHKAWKDDLARRQRWEIDNVNTKRDKRRPTTRGNDKAQKKLQKDKQLAKKAKSGGGCAVTALTVGAGIVSVVAAWKGVA